jgi:hypothetical protein
MEITVAEVVDAALELLRAERELLRGGQDKVEG